MSNAKRRVSPLRRGMIDDMSMRNLSPATQRCYLFAAAKFSRYSGRSPDCLDIEDVRSFQVYLVSQGMSWPSLNQAVCTLRFLALRSLTSENRSNSSMKAHSIVSPSREGCVLVAAEPGGTKNETRTNANRTVRSWVASSRTFLLFCPTLTDIKPVTWQTG